LCRPRWERFSEIVAGGAEFWTEATEGKTSDEIVDILLAEIQDGGSSKARGQMDYFEGLVSADVYKQSQEIAQHARFLDFVSTLSIKLDENADAQTNFDTMYRVLLDLLDKFYPER